MKKLIQKPLAEILISHRRWFSFLSLIVCFGLLLGLPKLGFDSSYRVFFSPDNPQLLAYDKLNSEYASTDNITFIVTSRTENIYTQDNIQTLITLTDKSWALPFSQRTQSLINYPYTEVKNIDKTDEFIVYDLVDKELWETKNGSISLVPPSYLHKLQQKALAEDLLVNRLISSDKSLAIVDVELLLENISPTDRSAIIDAAQRLQKEAQENSDLSVILAGSIMRDYAIQETSAADASTLLPLMLIFSILVNFAILRSLALLISSQIVIVLAVICGMGVAGWMQYDLNAVSAMAGLLIIILALADTVHIGATYLKELQKNKTPLDAIKISLQKNTKAVFLTSTTTATGFYSLNFMDSNAFADLGNIAIYGVSMAFVLSLTLFPSCLLLFTPKNPGTGIQQEALSRWIASIAINHQKPLFIVFFIITATTTPFLAMNQFNDDFLSKFPKDAEISIAADTYMEHMPAIHSISYSLSSGIENGINQPEYLRKIEAFVNWYKQQPEVTHVYSYVDFIKRLNKNMHNGDDAWYRIPENQPLAAQYLFLYEMSLGYGQSLSEVINQDKSALKITVTLSHLDNNGLMDVEERAKQWLLANYPEFDTTGTSQDIMFAHQGEHVVVNAQKGSALTVVLITIALIIGLGSFKYGAISMIPNLVPAGIIYGLWGMFIKDMDTAVAITYSVSLGLVVDDTVHVLSKYIQERRKGIAPKLAIEYTLENTATALIVTTIMIGGGLSIMALASFQSNAVVGLIMAPIIVVALLFDLFVFPGILLFLDEKLVRKTKLDTVNSPPPPPLID
mgnify:CR=1 FL=1